MIDIYGVIAVGSALIIGAIPLVFMYKSYKLGYRDFLVSWDVNKKYVSREMLEALRKYDIVSIERLKRSIDEMECDKKWER